MVDDDVVSVAAALVYVCIIFRYNYKQEPSGLFGI